MKQFVILIDMDDTIENLLPAWVDYLNDKHNTNVSTDSIKSWDIPIYFPSISRDEAYSPLYDDDFWKTVKPKQDAVENIKKLIRDGHKCFIVTTSSYKTIRAKMEEVLFKYFPYLSCDDVIITSNKQMIIGDFLIDDGIHNLVGGQYTKILMTMPHNANYEAEAHQMIRVHNWDDIYNIISRYSKI